MDRTSKTIRTIVEVALFAAIGYILDEIQGAFAVSFTSGGSIGIAMLPIIIIAYRRGWLPAILTGIIMGAFDMTTKAYIVHPIQVFLDYIFPYAFVGVAGFFKPLFDKAEDKKTKILWLVVGIVSGGTLKLVSHFLAGGFFWADPDYFAWNLNYMHPWLYSFLYNLAAVGPSIVLVIAVAIILYVRVPKVYIPEDKKEETKPVNFKLTHYIINSIIIAFGLALFIYFLIRFIDTRVWKPSSQKIVFNPDYFVLFYCGLSLVIVSIINIIQVSINKYKVRRFYLRFGVISLLMFGYSVAKISTMYIDPNVEIYNLYWLWFSVAFVFSAALTTFYIVKLKLDLKTKA